MDGWDGMDGPMIRLLLRWFGELSLSLLHSRGGHSFLLSLPFMHQLIDLTLLLFHACTLLFLVHSMDWTQIGMLTI
ncbi:hypothetical protein BCR43DRAFT_486636, partial [Syncephalastrum racemosum]